VKAGKLTKWVTLARSPQTTNDSDGFFEPLDPEGVWAGIEPLAPGADGRIINHLVTMRFHDQVSIDTRIVYGTRSLFVKGVQNVNEEDTELRLLCEEVVP
jgi:head-tail adaptor